MKHLVKISALSALLLILISGCVTSPQFSVEKPTKNEISTANNEIRAFGETESNNMWKFRKINRLDRVKEELDKPAKRLCLALSERAPWECEWQVSVDDNPDFNAYATDTNKIVMYMGTLNYTHSDEELAFVLAHEMSHHITDHIQDSTGLTLAEGLGLLAGLYIIGKGEENIDEGDYVDIVSTTTNIGSALSRPSYNRKQEREADFLALQILDDAGYNLAKAKQALINVSLMSKDKTIRSGFFSSHPSGSERLASFKKSMDPKSRIKLINKVKAWCSKQSFGSYWRNDCLTYHLFLD